MKQLLIICILALTATFGKAQKRPCVADPNDSVKYIAAGIWYWSVPALKDAAKESYFRVLEMVNNITPYTKGGFDTALNVYNWWRAAVDLKLKNQKEIDEFHKWVIDEAKANDKLVYRENNTPKQ